MGLPLRATPAPVQLDADGTARVANTRVTLETLVASFEQGATPEEIVQQYPSLSLTDVYETIGYFLRHRDEVLEYLRERQALVARVQREIEARFDAREIRARLMARRASGPS